MTAKDLSVMWTSIVLALGNHLWQSTVFAITAGLLTLILRKNHARARYWLWLAASVKFLIPFSLLIGIGSHIAYSRGSAGTNAGLYFAMEEVSHPFTQPMMPVISRAASLTVSQTLAQLLPVFLTAAWFCGFVVVVLVWYVRWRQISAAIREAVPLRDGREVETLRRLERIGGIGKPIEMLLSRASLEPGIFGIARPVLVWPEGISERLVDAHMEAILAHELWHVRRRDNLAAAIHMVVEAIFWFYPLVWWLGARLLEERERACDEEVLQMGGERQVYAESILKVCEFCVGSPLACVSGVTGANLKKRIIHIMTKRVSRNLDFSRKLLLSTAGVLAVAMPIVFGLVKVPQVRAQAPGTIGSPLPTLEIATVKPNYSGEKMTRFGLFPDRFPATNVSARYLIKLAYGVRDYQLSGAPGWIDERYDIEVKEKDSLVVTGARNLNGDPQQRRRLIVQALLASRFNLKVHHEIKNLPTFALVVATNGPKFSPMPASGFVSGRILNVNAHLSMTALPISDLAAQLSDELGCHVIDKTGLTGIYDLNLEWIPTTGSQQAAGSTASPESSRLSIFMAIQEQLGLKLEPQTSPVEILVIDRVEKPSEN